jgi:hypothetical protein
VYPHAAAVHRRDDSRADIDRPLEAIDKTTIGGVLTPKVDAVATE